MAHSSFTSGWLRAGFCAAAVIWALLLPAAALAAGRTGGSSIVTLSAALPYAIGAVICHQQAARSFALWSQQLPVCARCTGLYFGAAIAAALGAVRAVQPVRLDRLPGVARRFSPASALLSIAALPTAATLIYEWSTGMTPSNVVRAMAGVLLGAAVVRVVLAAVDDQVN